MSKHDVQIAYQPTRFTCLTCAGASITQRDDETTGEWAERFREFSKSHPNEGFAALIRDHRRRAKTEEK